MKLFSWRPELLKSQDAKLFPVTCSIGKLLSVIFRRRIRSSTTAVIRPGGMGDLILLCVAMEELKLDLRRFTFFIETRSQPWADFIGLNYVCFNRGFLKTLFRWASRFNTVVNTEQLFGSSQALALAIGRPGQTQIGFDTNRAKTTFTQVVSYDPYQSHESTEFKKLFLGLADKSLAPASAPAFLPRRFPAEDHYVVGVAGTGSPSRTFSAADWNFFSSFIAKGSTVFIVCAPPDLNLARQIEKNYRESGYKVYLKCESLEESCLVIRSAKRVFTIDGGLVHVASYFGIPTTCLFTSGRDTKWSPLGEFSYWILRKDIPCRPCTLFGQVPECPHQYRCKDLEKAVLEPVPNRNSLPA